MRKKNGHFTEAPELDTSLRDSPAEQPAPDKKEVSPPIKPEWPRPNMPFSELPR